MFNHWQEDAPDHMATPSESCREYARNFGADHPEQAWVSTPFDSWERNPFYDGPPREHPEFECNRELEREEADAYYAANPHESRVPLGPEPQAQPEPIDDRPF